MANANVDKRSSLRRKLLKLDTKVAVVGSGWIGRALAKRFWDANISVVIGSRNPSASEKSRFDVPCRVITVEEACQWADVIVLAVPCTTHTRLVPVLENAAWDKVVIDCSNRSPNSKNTLSVAEELQQMLPNCKIVKAFNDTSAYELNKHSATSVSEKILRFCGDDETSKVMLRSLLERMGSSFRDVGSLKSARILEAIPYQFFDEWRSSLFIAAPCFLFVVLYSPHWYLNSKENPYVFAKRFVSISGHYSLLLLSVVYLAGIIAALYQMFSGTATKSFPKWLSNWLAVRKHLGLIALWFAFYHVISSCFLNIPISMYDAGDDGTGRTLNRFSESSMLLGFISFGLYTILGITSIPSVAARLSWREWTFIQSVIGYVGLLTGLLHAMLLLMITLCKDQGLACKEFGPVAIATQFNTWTGKVPPLTWPVIFLPVTVMVFKFFLSIPPFSWRLDRIRSGHQYRSLLSYCSCRRPTTTTTTPEPPKRRNTVLRRLLSLKLRAQLTPDNTVMTHTGEDIHDAIPSYDLSECSTPRKVGLTPRSDPDTPPPQNLRIMKFVEEKV